MQRCSKHRCFGPQLRSVTGRKRVILKAVAIFKQQQSCLVYDISRYGISMFAAARKSDEQAIIEQSVSFNIAAGVW